MKSVLTLCIFLYCLISSPLFSQTYPSAELWKELPPEVAGELYEALRASPSGEVPGGLAAPSAHLARHLGAWQAARLDGNPPEDYRVIAEYRKRWDDDQAGWVHADSVEYTYDERNNRIESLGRVWDGTLWVRSWREVSTYNADNQRTSSTEESWDGAGWGHENGDGQTLIEYNEDGNITLYHQRGWQDGEWLDWYKYVLAYDPVTGNLASETALWAIMPGNLENDFRTLFTSYDGEGNPLLLIGQSWEEGEWVTEWRQSREYDEDGNLLLRFFQAPDGQNWIDDSRVIYNYNSEGLITDQTGQYWEADAQSWVFEYRIEYEYNNNGDLTLFAYSRWDENTASWVGDFRDIAEYDENFNLALRWSQYWNRDVGYWENSTRSIYTPDANGNIRTLEYQSWSVDENAWEKRNHTTYYYEVFVGTKEVQTIDPSAVAISPNPGSGLFRIQLDADAFPGAEVEISAFNLTGQPARSRWVARAGNTLDVDLSGLAGGTYILQIRQDGRIAVKKVVVVK